jgi:outer membrane protein TolC
MLGTSGIAQTATGSLSFVKGTQSAGNPNTKIDLNLSQKFPTLLSKNAPNTLVGVSASQTILDGYPGGQTQAAIDKALVALKGREIAWKQSGNLVILNVKKAYITMLAAQRSLATRRGIFEKQNAILKQVTAIYSLKQASTVDLQNASINAKTASLDVETARHDLALARQRLANLAGMDGRREFAIADIPDPALPVATVEEAIARGLENRSELSLAELNGKSAAIDLAVAKGQSTATISVSGGVNIALVWTGPVQSAGSANLGIRLGLPLMDSGATKDLVDSNLALMSVYESQKRQLAKTIEADIRDAFWMAGIQSQRIELAKQSKELYASKFAIVKAQNSFGTASLQDLLSASVDSANADASYEAAKSAYLLSILALEAAMGL